MSYLFGANNNLAGSFASTYGLPITVAVYIKITTHPIADDSVAQIGSSSSSNNDSLRIHTHSVDDGWRALSTTSGGVEQPVTLSSVNIDGVWAGFIGVFTSSTLRDVYVQSSANTASNNTSNVVSSSLQHLKFGENLQGGNDFTGRLAELAIWKKALTTGEIDSYMNGTASSQIAAADLIGYWPLSASNATQSNEGVDTGGDLTVTGATFDSDHPTITTGTAPSLYVVRSSIRLN